MEVPTITKAKPMSSAERVQAFRKRKAESDPQYRQKENERIATHLRQQKENMTTDELQKHRKQTAELVRLCRLRKKMKKEEEKGSEKLVVKMGPGFKSPQSLGKAVKKLKQSLPESPSKQIAAVTGLAKSVGLKLNEKMQCNLLGKTKRGLSEEDEKIICDFYFRTDIVYTMPGMNDQMTVWENGVKSKLRKYYLVMFLKEVFVLFKKCYPDVSVAFSKFASLRPTNILLLKDQSPDQCKCQTHENFFHKLKALGISYDEDYWSSVICKGSHDDLMSSCWKGDCQECKVGKKLVIKKTDAETVHWKEWAKNETGRLRLNERQGCVGQLKDKLFDGQCLG